jgi:hypothetical protein
MADFKNSLTLNGSAVLTALTGYTKTQLSTSGQSSVHFNNLTNKPTTIAGYGITDAPTKTGSGASGTWTIHVTGSAGSVGADDITGQVGMWTSANRPGPTRLYRRDDDGGLNVQTHWVSPYWVLQGYNGNTYHAPCRVGYADVADSLANGASGGTAVFTGNLTATWVTTSQNSQSGYVFYDRTVANSYWVLYSQDSTCRLYRGSDLFTVNATGNVGIRQSIWSQCALQVKGIGTTSGSYGLIVYDSAGNNTHWIRDDGAGYLKAGAWSYSDRRNKQDIVDITDGLKTVLALRPKTYSFKDDETHRTRFGFIAQEVEEIAPNLVDYSIHPGKTEPQYSLDYDGIIAPLVSSVHTLHSRIEQLTERLNAVERRDSHV